MSFSALTYSSKESVVNEQMNAFIKKVSKMRPLVDKMTSVFKKFDFMTSFSHIALLLLQTASDPKIALFVVDVSIKAAEMSPVLAGKIAPELILEIIAQLDLKSGHENNSTSQLLYEHVCRYFEVQATHDIQGRVLKQLVAESIAKVFDESFKSINFVLVFSKLLFHLNKLSVRLSEREFGAVLPRKFLAFWRLFG